MNTHTATQLTLPLDLPTADTGWCQRWRLRQPGWQHRHLGGFDPDRYTVALIAARPARLFVLQHHYSASWPKAQLCYGLLARTPDLDDYPDPHPTARTPAGLLVGVAALSIPMHPAVLTKPFPGLVPNRESLDLGRFVLLDPVPGNAETWFLARVFRLAASAGIGGAVAFSDPMPRCRFGELLMGGHHGIAYQGGNGRHVGTSRGGPLVLFPDATSMPARTLTKIRTGAQGWRGAAERLILRGASPYTSTQPLAQWLPPALTAAGATVVQHPGTFKYAWQIRTGRDARIALPALPYPKPPTSIDELVRTVLAAGGHR
ncbi:hypothetical protein ACFO1B_43990 [Dactylosporangium siamense]|uniref:Uncharacterized protein n=1 Tax=Dactylosporangium siamense TaxID=685454 RepID=A0A919Q2G9_9ACTN|nr:hypothetical protein [Dactylosporangium siamense]GIG53198.1 hypothetical protein Dsi01nite_112390 [Dactylosporangium siamense]